MSDMYRFEYEDIVFQDAVTATANGTALSVGGKRDLTVEITGATATATRTVSFYGTGASGTLIAIQGVNYATITAVATSTAGIGEIWGFDITGLHQVYMAVTAISGDTVSVTGRAIA